MSLDLRIILRYSNLAMSLPKILHCSSYKMKTCCSLQSFPLRTLLCIRVLDGPDKTFRTTSPDRGASNGLGGLG